MTETPHWERGMRGHGYWIGTRRLGYVSLPPRGYKVLGGPLLYSWGVDGIRGEGWEGTARRLDTAKQAVERAVARLLAGEAPERAQERAAILSRYAAFAAAIAGFTGINEGSMAEFARELGVDLDDEGLIAHLETAGWEYLPPDSSATMGGIYMRKRPAKRLVKRPKIISLAARERQSSRRRRRARS